MKVTVIPEKRETKEMSPKNPLAFCLEALSGLWRQRLEFRAIEPPSLRNLHAKILDKRKPCRGGAPKIGLWLSPKFHTHTARRHEAGQNITFRGKKDSWGTIS